MGVMGRANQGAGGGGGPQEPYLSKDELIRYKTPLAIRAIDYDKFGSSTYRTPRWILTVEAWDANHPIPDSAYPADRDIEPAGLITFGDSEVRTSQFGPGRDPQDNSPVGLQAQLDDARAQGVEWIGPVAVVSALSKTRQPFKTLADVKLDEVGNVVVDSRGFPVLEGAPEAQPARQQAPGRAVAAPAPVQEARRSTGQRQRRAAQAASEPAPTPPAAPVAAPRVPRAATAPATAPAAETAPSPAPAAATPRRQRAQAQQAIPAGPPPDAAAPQGAAAYEAQQQREAQREALAAGPAQTPGVDASGRPYAAVRERTETVAEASATCPFCQQEIQGRLYPAPGDGYVRAYEESARVFGWPELTPDLKAAGGQVIMHPNCPMIQRTITLPFVQFDDEG